MEGTRGTTGNTKKVMVAMDESECSKYALEWTLQNLKETIANSVLVIFTVQPTAEYNYISFGSASPDLMKTIQETHKKVATTLLEGAKEICGQYGIVPVVVTEEGEPKVAICREVEKLSVNFLVVGSHGLGALKRALLGSVSNYCVYNAKCPVLVVKRTV